MGNRRDGTGRQLSIEHLFEAWHDGLMTGGMTPPSRGGVPLKDRPIAGPGARVQSVNRPRPARHCWVASATRDDVPHAGLVIEWRKRDADWWALVTYVVDEDGAAVVVTQWVSADLLRPVPE